MRDSRSSVSARWHSPSVSPPGTIHAAQSHYGSRFDLLCAGGPRVKIATRMFIPVRSGRSRTRSSADHAQFAGLGKAELGAGNGVRTEDLLQRYGLASGGRDILLRLL